jgi:hypothetical protein
LIIFSYFNFFPLSRNAVVNALNPFSLCVEDELHSCKSQQQSCTVASTPSHQHMLKKEKWLSKPREFSVLQVFNFNTRVTVMDEGTVKTPIPKCRLYWSFCFWVVKQFCSF